jgi:hypothetical protein
VHVQKVSGLNDKAPTGPDQTSSHKSTVLRERKRFDGTSKVGSTGEDETPLHDGSPEVDSLGTDGRRQELLEARLRLSRSWDGGIGSGCGRVCACGLAGVGGLLAEGIEESESGSERHDCCLYGVTEWRCEGKLRLKGRDERSIADAAFRRYLEPRPDAAMRSKSGVCVQRLPFPQSIVFALFVCIGQQRDSNCRESVD